MRLALLLVGASMVGGCAPRGFRIIDKPIAFSDERVRMTQQYIAEHYGREPGHIYIVPRIIVLHWTAIDDFDASFQAFDRETLSGRPDLEGAGQVNVSVQFLVDRDGRVYRLMPERWMGRHVIGLNHNAIGVENVGGAGGADNLTQAQIEANVALVRYLAEKYPTIEYLIGHGEYQSAEGHPLWKELDDGYRTVKSDPSPRFMEAVRAELEPLSLRGPDDLRREAARTR